MMAAGTGSAASTRLETSDLVLALKQIGVTLDEYTGLQAPDSDPQPIQLEQALASFRAAAATPEQRLALAARHHLSYHDLTEWAIRADLLRVPTVDANAAELIALTGVIGMHDLAAWQEWDPPLSHTPELIRRVEALKQALDEKLSAMEDTERARELRQRASGLDLRRIVDEATSLARQQPSEIVAATEVIVVVKGAGSQKAEETLDSFINGFWPAVKSIEREATITRRYDLELPELASTSEPWYRRGITEIHAGERRIWITEAHWETVLRPPKALKALFLEWQMTTYAFGRHIHELIQFQSRLLESLHLREISARTLERRVFWEHYLSFLLQYLFVFLFLGWVFWSRSTIQLPVLSAVAPTTAETIALGTLTAIFAAIPAALRTYRAQRRWPLMRLQGLPRVLLVVMILAFLLNPLRYLLGLSLLYLIQVAALIGRDIVWPYRVHPDSDTDLSRYNIEVDDSGGPRLHRQNMRREKLLLSPLLYRYIVVLVTPIVLVILAVARISQWTIVLRPIGRAIEETLHNSLSGVLGDVVTYAMDPAQAHRVRSVIEAEIAHFHARPDVDNIHVFAHSQGTPITFELLFHYLPAAYRPKIKSYVTIGSVLGYYHQSNPVLDPILIPRFPVPAYHRFASEFRWYNFWNSYDPITEFSALDEFKLYQIRAFESGSGETEYRVEPSHANPINLKTRGTWLPWAGHTEYWSNLAEVQIPFAYRVIGDTHREEWQPTIPLSPPAGLSYTSLLALVTLPILAILVAIATATQDLSRLIAQRLQNAAFLVRIEEQIPDGAIGDRLVAMLHSFFSLPAIPDFIWLLLIVLVLGVISWLRMGIAALALRRGSAAAVESSAAVVGAPKTV